MTHVSVSRLIHASQQQVFDAVADLAHLPDVNPDVVSIDFLGDQQSGVGTRFRETRAMGKKRMTTDLEVTEWRPPTHARMVADSHGTIWDTVFTVAIESSGCRLTIAMDARARKLLPKLLNPLFKGLFRRGLHKHIDHVKAYCEKQPAAAEAS